MNLTLGRLIKSGFLLSGFDTSFSTDQNLSSSDFHQPVFFYWGSWRKEFRNQKNFQPVRFSRPIFEKFKTLAIVTPQIAKLTQILQKIHILEFKLSKRNFQITKIVTLTQIVTHLNSPTYYFNFQGNPERLELLLKNGGDPSSIVLSKRSLWVC